ncbi:hypothetical protein PsorP6_001732 [Peronosclerospora sorghi]|uniref:Uncharacterized protein n=1 Tax=Peronosclerospora sorghi TaxID=230839 RepID=A0ACC0WYL8_9STRA|nr:hypothetical protein PsorP6_001732 [Peronosclerospora sorghi]
MPSSSPSPGHSSSFSRFFSRRSHRASRALSVRTGFTSSARPHPSQAQRIRLVNTLSVSELYALRELVHRAANKSFVPSSTKKHTRACHSSAGTVERTRRDARKAATRTRSSVTRLRHHAPPTPCAIDLITTKRFYFNERADQRLRLPSRRHLVRLFPRLTHVSKAAQRVLFHAFDANASGKIEFDELCAMLARVKRARGTSVHEMAELVCSWFQDEPATTGLSCFNVQLLALTAMELDHEAHVLTEYSHDVVASLTKLILNGEATHVTQATFCQRMECHLGAQVLQLLLAPFHVTHAVLEEATLVDEAETCEWTAGDTAYLVSTTWWTPWQQYVRARHVPRTHHAATPRGEQEPGDQERAHRARPRSVRGPGACYACPGPISNRDLAANEELGTLRPHLVHGRDFVLVPARIWHPLVQLYGGGPEYKRQVVPDAPRDPTEPQPRVTVDLYPIVLPVRLARHDARHVFLVYTRRFMVPRDSSLKELVHRMGIFPDVNATEVTLWLRRHRLQAWIPLDGSLDATLERLAITSAQELLVDFRALDLDDDPHSRAQAHRRQCLAAMKPREPFHVAMLQPIGNDFLACPRASLARFARTGNWYRLRTSLAAELDTTGTVSSFSAHYERPGAARGGGWTNSMEGAARASRGRLVTHAGIRATGLVNMGNTCFMNSALQCFVHSPIFREYFLSTRYELEVNKKNRLGSRGAIAAAYAQLVSSMWREREHGYLIPGRFRDAFIQVRAEFEDLRQYDAHEFMVALLDCLHEDLNQGRRTHHHGRPPLATEDDVIQAQSSRCLSFSSFRGTDDGRASLDRCEPTATAETDGDAAWREYTQVNASVVVDLFHGQMRSETVCHTCGERKCTFDPNLFLSLPIPESTFVRLDVLVLLQARTLPCDETKDDPRPPVETRGFWLRRGSSVQTLCDRIAAVHGRASGHRFLLVELRRHRIKRILEPDERVEKLVPILPGALAAYERAWTLDELPVVPALVSDYFTTWNGAAPRARACRSFADLHVGARVQARGQSKDWEEATVIHVAATPSPRVCLRFEHERSQKRTKWFTARDWHGKGRGHEAVARPAEVFEVQVVHRVRARPEQTSGDRVRDDDDDDPTGSWTVFGLPLFLTMASDKTAHELHHALVFQTARFWRRLQRVSGTAWQDTWMQSKVPYTVRIVDLEHVTRARGTDVPLDASALMDHFAARSVLVLDWMDRHEYASEAVRAADDVPLDVWRAADTDAVVRAELDDKAVLDGRGAAHDRVPPHAVPLTRCMDALMRDELISREDAWICEHCGVPREGTRRSSISRLPDLVMIQLKRFQYLENQQRQKVRAVVDFPLQGLDFAPWMDRPSRPSDDAADDSTVYDLYAVANHVGGLTRGHYTASCRYDAEYPESAALFQHAAAPDVQCPELWFRFDDDKVAEMAPGDVVTDAAYVLFYKRRTLSSSNVLRYAL